MGKTGNARGKLSKKKKKKVYLYLTFPYWIP